MADISNSNNNTLIVGTASDDTIWNYGEYVTIEAVAGDDNIYNLESSNVKIDGGAGNDTIWNVIYGRTLDGVLIESTRNVTISGGDGADSIVNNGSNILIDGGDGDDTIGNGNLSNTISNITVFGGAGNDHINFGSVYDINSGSFSTGNNGVVYTYNEGDGNDTLFGFPDTFQINSSVGWSSVVSDSDSGNGIIKDIVITVGDGSITIWHAATSSGVNINGVTYPIDNGGGGN